MACLADRDCWCISFPHILPLNTTEGCLCPSCLEKTQSDFINGQEEILPQHKKAIQEMGPPTNPKEHVDYYMENGLLVMTKWYLLRRGHCCENGCKHCPY